MMHWLQKFREEYRRKDGGAGISKDELAEMVKIKDTGCSGVLIGILENGGITHPEIAKRIAKVTGATTEQYNSIVHKMHHGGYTPSRSRKITDFEDGKRPQPLSIGVTPANARSVVCIDQQGNMLSTHSSVMAAAAAMGTSVGVVNNRCKKLLNPESNEFDLIGCTFRFADEWIAMDPQQRMADLQMGAAR